MQDIRSFLKNDIIKTMTIVTNKGNVWYMSKNDGYNYSGAYALMRKKRGGKRGRLRCNC